MSTETQIVLKQTPIITHQLQVAGKKVQKRIDELELDKQIVTEENVKSMKVLKAELSKEFKGYEEQRGMIKNAVNNPYQEFEAVYKTEITERYKNAETLLKSKIDSVEYQIKKNKENNVREYFDELVIAEKIDFLKFESLNIEINLSTCEKKYKEQVYDFIVKVTDDLALIKTTEFEAEIFTEYSKSLNVSNAITTVKTRKEQEAATQARIKAEQRQNRENYLSKLGLNYVEITNAWEYNADIYVSLSDVINLPKEIFTEKYEELKVKINALKDAEIKPETIEVKGEVYEVSKTEGINPETGHSRVVKPISAPKVETPSEEIKTASFEVKATMTKLRALGEYMRSQGIEYKNI